jgi:hypothetical protein
MKCHFRSSRLAALAGLITILALPTAALDLVRDGQPVATIVVSSGRAETAQPPGKRPARKAAPGATLDEAGAAEVLVDWIKKITDAELPVGNAPVQGKPAIYVGRAAVKAGLKLEGIQSPSHEGVRIVADEQRVLIGGQNGAATFKAACRFLEELGCRYFMDGPLGEVHPRTRTLSVGQLSITESPGLLGRNPKGPTWGAALWKAWNGAGGETFQHQHSWGRYLSPTLFQEHPDYFAMGADGQRRPGDWACTSNKDLRKHFASQVIAVIRAGTRHPSISPPDGRGYCQCPACKAQDDPKSIEPSSGLVSISSRYVDFFDDVARQVAAACPDSVLSFYCYADYTQPPPLKRKLSPNLCAVIAPIRYCRTHEIGHAGCASREQQVAMTEGWANVASRLGYYNYMYNLADGTLPFFKFTACKKEFPYLKKAGLCHMTIEVLSNWQIYGPQIYLSLRLAYDPAADADRIMEDYWPKFYGPRAASFMKQYWMGLDAEQDRLPSHAGGFFGLQQMFTPEFLQKCQALLDKAAEAARGEPLDEQRVALHTEGFKSAVEYMRVCEAMNRGQFRQAREVFDPMRARLHGLAAKDWANREYATAYLDRFLAKGIEEGAALTAPPNKLLQVLPDRWRFQFDEEARGLERGYPKADCNDTAWPLVETVTKTLDVQGYDKNTVLWYRTRFDAPARPGKLALFFAEVDGYAEVFVNGTKLDIAPPPAAGSAKAGKALPDGRARPRVPFEVDISSTTRPGENVLAVRVDHTKITELSLGGILRPVLLVQKAAQPGQ